MEAIFIKILNLYTIDISLISLTKTKKYRYMQALPLHFCNYLCILLYSKEMHSLIQITQVWTEVE